MVAHMADAGRLHSAGVEQALRTVPRHLFVPEASIEDAYANKAITTKPGGAGGRPASCASVPTVVAMMLGQLDVQPGNRILEIGAGTGYDAALLAELAGDTGEVSTIDIHPDVTERAQHALHTAGYDTYACSPATARSATASTHRMTASSSQSARGTSRPPGSTSSPPAVVSWYRCTGAAKPEASPSSARTTGCCGPPTANSAASSR